MIEVLLELKLNSFLVNSTGDSSGLAAQMSDRMLEFTCDRILSVRQLTEDKPTTGFEFLDAPGVQENAGGTDAGFDSQITHYFAAHTQFDISKVMIAFGADGYRVNPKESSNGEIGRMFIRELPNQSSLELDLVLKQNEFDSIWSLITKQDLQRVIATFICFQPKNPGSAERQLKHVVGILSSSLQMMPNA
jgi:hypothetical protein